jgi:hypothetical protein
MAMSDKSRETLTAELTRIKREKFVPGYQATDAEAFGLLTSEFFDWDGADIMRTAGYALEDANFHGEAAQLDAMAQRIEA